MLKIGVLSHTLKDSRRLLREIIESEHDNNKIVHTAFDRAWLSDETVYYALQNDSDSMRGIKFDQLIISDKYLFDSDFYSYVVIPMLGSSCVPEEYLIQVFE